VIGDSEDREPQSNWHKASPTDPSPSEILVHVPICDPTRLGFQTAI